MSSKYLTSRQLGLSIIYFTFFGPAPFAATLKPGRYQAELKGFINPKQAKSKGNTEEDLNIAVYTGSQAHSFKGLFNNDPKRFFLGLFFSPILLPAVAITLITATVTKRIVDAIIFIAKSIGNGVVSMLKGLGSLFLSKQTSKLNENVEDKEEANPEYISIPVPSNATTPRGVITTRPLGTYDVQSDPEVKKDGIHESSTFNPANETHDYSSVETYSSKSSRLSAS